MPRESLALLRRLDVPVQFILGNGDREVLAQARGEETDWFRAAPGPWREPVRWTAGQLDPGDVEAIATWPATLRLAVPGLGDVLFCHGTPRSDTEVFTRLTPDERLLPLFEGLGAALVVCGHTHMPFDRRVGPTRVVNAGSAGMPFGRPGADWLLLGPGVEPRHTDYDLEAAAARVRGTAYPQAEEFVARSVLRPPSEEETLALFARAEPK
jgi:predicted phosphodiesterase